MRTEIPSFAKGPDFKPINYSHEGPTPRKYIYSSRKAIETSTPGKTFSRFVMDPTIRPETAELLFDAIHSDSLEAVNQASKTIVTNYFLFGMNLEEIGETIERSKQVAKKRVSRAMVELWQALPSQLQEKYTIEDVSQVRTRSRIGLRHSDETKERLKKIQERRMKDPEILAAVKQGNIDSMTTSRRRKLRKDALRRHAGGVYSLRSPNNQLFASRKQLDNPSTTYAVGHRFNSTESIAANRARHKKQIPRNMTHGERLVNPLEGAILNLEYFHGTTFPKHIREFFASSVISFAWRPVGYGPESSNLSYSAGEIWYHHSGNKVKLDLNSLRTLWVKGDPQFRRTITVFGVASKRTLTDPLDRRVKSFSTRTEQVA